MVELRELVVLLSVSFVLSVGIVFLQAWDTLQEAGTAGDTSALASFMILCVSLLVGTIVLSAARGQ